MKVFSLGLALLLAACASRKVAEEPAPEPVAAVPEANGSHDDDLLSEAERDARYRREFEAVMYRRHLELAQRLHRAGELERALVEVRKALVYRPASEEAERLRSQILFEQGARSGAVNAVMDDHYERYRVKMEERKVTARRLLGQAERYAEEGDYQRARATYERVIFITRDDRRLTDPALEALGAEARGRLDDLDDAEAKARRERERKDIEEALDRIEKER